MNRYPHVPEYERLMVRHGGNKTDFISIPLWPELDLRLNARIVDAELVGQSRSLAFLLSFSTYIDIYLYIYPCILSVLLLRILYTIPGRSFLSLYTSYTTIIFYTIFPHIFAATCPHFNPIPIYS